MTILSIFAFFWGANYVSNWQNLASAGFSSLMGQTDPTFATAKMARDFSPFAFIFGAILCVFGFVKR